MKNLGLGIALPRPVYHNVPARLSAFADAILKADHGQLSIFPELLLGPLAQDSIYDTLSWMYKNSKRPVRSIAAIEVLHASEPIDVEKTLKRALSTLLCIPVKLIVVVDSTDIFTSLSTRRNLIDKSIRADENVIRFEYEVRNVDEMCWLPGPVNLADPGTKTTSPLNQSLQLLMNSGIIPIDISRHESRQFERPLG